MCAFDTQPQAYIREITGDLIYKSRPWAVTIGPIAGRPDA
jgi:hypothetical protein